MAATKVSLKLLIDKKSHQALFAEAAKELVDFLITILALPIGPVMAAGQHVLVFCFNFFRKLGPFGSLLNIHILRFKRTYTYFNTLFYSHLYQKYPKYLTQT